MSKTEILAELPTLRRAELAEVQAKLDELAGEVWLDDGELAHADKAALNAAQAAHKANPNAGRLWEEAKSGMRSKPRQWHPESSVRSHS